MKKIPGVFAVLMFILGKPAAASVHTYKIAKLADTAEQCKTEESKLVEKFAKLSAASVLSHGCEANPARSYDLVIEYSKPTALNLVSTYSDSTFVHGLFASNEECVAELEGDSATFQILTGLEPVVSYCYRERGGDDMSPSWTMRIDGFGAAKLVPQHFAKSFYHGISGDRGSMSVELKSTLEAFGAVGARVIINSTKDKSTIHALYYAAGPLPIVTYNDGQFGTMDACESRRTQMQEIFARADGRAALTFCGTSSYLPHVDLFAAGVVMQPLATDVTAVKYTTFEDCEAHRIETENQWREALNKNIIGSICAIEDDIISQRIRLRMFWLD